MTEKASDEITLLVKQDHIRTVEHALKMRAWYKVVADGAENTGHIVSHIQALLLGVSSALLLVATQQSVNQVLAAASISMVFSKACIGIAYIAMREQIEREHLLVRLLEHHNARVVPITPGEIVQVAGASML